MQLPFQLIKTFTTSLSSDEVLAFVKERLNRKHKFPFLSSNEYIGSIDDSSFNLYKAFNSKYGRSNPKVSGTIISDNPTTIEIKISPHYFRVLFFLTFPLVFIPGAIFSDQMTINGVLREPE
jgi:hypothetical protein